MEKEINGTPDSGKSNWNINASFSGLIARRLAISQRFFDENNITAYFNILRSIYELTTYNLSEGVKQKMDRLVLKISRNRKYYQKCLDKKSNELNIKLIDEDLKGKWIYEEDIRQFQRNVLKILKSSGFLTNIALRSHIKF